jgi:hypothetical protein
MYDRAEILKIALKLVTGNRQEQNGSIDKNHENIARLWTSYLQNEGLISKENNLTSLNVAILMCLLKIARSQAGEYNPDDYVDLCGYGSIAGQIADQNNPDNDV